MKYETVAEAYRDLEQASGRLALTDRLAILLAGTPAELLPTARRRLGETVVMAGEGGPPVGAEAYEAHGRAGGERARWRVMYGYVRPHRLALLTGGVLSLLTAATGLALLMTTVLVVAHRLSTVTMADRIIVMDAGRVKAAGTHAELVATDPLYAELAATQFLASTDTPVA